MGIITPKIREEIEFKLKKIAGNPEYYDKRGEFITQEIRSLGDIYSFWIENPKLRKQLLIENKQPKTLLKEARRGISNINNAWYYLSNIGKHGNFVNSLDENILKKTNELVSPIRFNGKKISTDFRTGNVTLGFEDYLPPSSEYVPEEISSLISKVKKGYNDNPLESAITAHLGITGIQPFDEGNKRTARLIQNRILLDTNMPPVVIPAGESIFYFSLIKKALSETDQDPNKSKPFYDYCASKVNNGLDEILGDLSLH